MEKSKRIEFNFVYGRDAVQIKKFIDKIPRGVDCINYMTILNRLEKNDFMQHEPTTLVVSSYLMKSLYNSLNKKNVEKIYYVISSPDPEVINNIKETCVEIINDDEVNWDWILHYDIQLDIEEIATLINKTKKIEEASHI